MKASPDLDELYNASYRRLVVQLYAVCHVVVLHYVADLGIAEIAGELGVPEGTAKSRLSRARSKLAHLLDEREEPRHV